MTTTPDLSQAIAERAVAPERSGPTLSQLIARQRDQIAAALPKHMDADRLVRIALTQLRQTPRLGDCTPQSVLGALMLASQLGVEPGPLGQCYLVPFRNNNLGTTECQFILGYKGIIDLAWRSDRLLSIEARDVHAGDAFEYRYGLHPVLDHVPTLNGNRGGVTCYYGLATFKDGGSYFVVVGQPEIDEHRGRSRAANAGPWVTDPVAMAKKTVIRMMVPYLPLSAENIAQLSTDEAVVHEIPLDYHQVADAVDDAPEPVAIEAVAEPAPTPEPPPAPERRAHAAMPPLKEEPAKRTRRRQKTRAELEAEQAIADAAAAPPEPEPEPEPEPPAPSPDPEPPAETGETVTATQLILIRSLLDATGYYEPGEAGQAGRARHISNIVGHEVTTPNDLLASEAVEVIRMLELLVNGSDDPPYSDELPL